MSVWMSKLIERYSEINEKEKKKLDPVGKADADIDNDGDVDKSDSYLHNRRKAVTKAIKGKDEEVEMNPTKKKDKATANDMTTNEASVGKLMKYAKDAAKDIDNKRNVVKHAMRPGASQKDAEKGIEAMKGLKKRSKGSDMYTDKMTGRSKVKPTAEDTLPPVYAKILEKRDMHMKGATKPEEMMDNESQKSKEFADMHKAGAKMDDTEEKGHQDASKAGRATQAAAARPGDNKSGDKNIINPVKGNQ